MLFNEFGANSVTIQDVKNAAKLGQNITVIINGQYYDLDLSGIDDNGAFIDGVRFAAAIIEDDRARANLVFNAIAKRKRTPARVIACNEARNDEIKHLSNKLLSILNNLPIWKLDYKNNKLWKLEK